MKNKKYSSATKGLTNVKYDPDKPTPIRGKTWPTQKTVHGGHSGSKHK